MNDKKLTILIDRREALPVRAIPHVTKWIRFYPDKVAKHFARDDCVSPFARGRLLIDAYHLSGNAPVQVMPSEWDAVIARLEGFEAETRKQYGRDDSGERIGYAAWCNGATAKLPEGVFVWLDEFEKVFQADVKSTPGSYDKPGDDKLTLAPMLDATTRAMVRAGFETLPAATGESCDAAGKVEAGAVPNPSGDNDEQRDTTGQNYWRVVLNSNIKKVDEHKKATVRGIIKYLRNLNNARLPNEGGHDELIWIDDMGNRQCVQKKSVSNAVSEARKLS